MKRMSIFMRTFAFLFCFLLMGLSLISTAHAAVVELPPTTGASSVYVYHYESDRVLLNRTGSARQLPASTVKMMTGLIAIEMLRDRLDEYIMIHADMLSEVEGITIRLQPNTSVRILDLLYGVICGGGNDAAIVLAIVCAGSVDSFVTYMNNQAKAWGCVNTNYTNPTGIDENGMYTTLHDTVIIAKHAAENDLFLEMSSVSSYSYKPLGAEESTLFYNRNALLSSFSAIGYQNRFAKGLNAGMTDGGGYCLCTYASNGKDSYLCVVMGAAQLADGTILSYEIANSLLNELFQSYSYRTVATVGTPVTSAPVSLALPNSGENETTVSCVLAEDLRGFLPKDVNASELVYEPYFHDNEIMAPIEKGAVLGGVDVYWNDQWIAHSKLIAEESVESVPMLVVMKQMKTMLLSRQTVLCLVTLVLLLGVYFGISCFKSKRKQETKRWR